MATARPRFALALVVRRSLLVATVCLASCQPHNRHEDDQARAFADLRGVRLATRPFAPRLVGGFAYAPLAASTRGTAETAAIDLRLAAARLEKRLASDRSPAALADYAAGALMTNDPAKAIGALQEALRSSPHDARLLSDLAAAYLVRGSQSAIDANEDQVQALESASLAVAADPALAEAWFNRALAMQGILPAAVVASSWSDFLQRDSHSGWASEARDRVRAPTVTSLPDMNALERDADIANAVARARQQARELVLERLAPAWASAIQEHRADEAARQLRRAGALAEALQRQTHDPFTSEVVAWMRTAPTSDVVHTVANYARARQAYVAEQRDEADRIFTRLNTRLAADTALKCWIGLQLTTIAIDRRDITRARTLLREPSRIARQRGYRAAEARALWLAGLIDHQSNAIDAALKQYEQAAAIYADLGERENELAVFTATADNLRLRGERRRSWAYVLRVLGRSGEITTPLRRYLAFFNASLFASDAGWWHAALVFQDNAIREAAGTPSLGPTIEALTIKARLQLHLGDRAGSAQSLAAARSALQRFGPDAYASATLDAVSGEGDTGVDERAADRELSAALTFFEHAEPAEAARLYLLRGRARLGLGDVSGAEEDFRSGMADVERRRQGIGSAQLRVSYLDDTADLFADMAALQLHDRHDAAAAFDAVERGRARTLADASHAQILPLAALPRALPAGVALIEYKLLRDELACWVITRAGYRVTLFRASPDAVAVAVDRFRLAIQDPASPDTNAQAEALYRLLLAPVENDVGTSDTLAIIPDGPLTLLPFAALRPGPRRYVIHTHAVIEMPSAASFIASLGNGRVLGGNVRTALLVGAPDVDRTAFPGLLPLPGAAAEAKSLVALYRHSEPLLGAAATRPAFLSAIGSADVVHFAGHAIENADNPDMSALVLAPAPGDVHGGVVRAIDIADLRLAHTRVVVLAACDTADGPVTRSEGVHSLARPFLNAGVRDVVATLWKIDDAASADLFYRLHAHLASGEDVVDALRAAQLELLAIGGDAAHPRAWGGVVVLGAVGKSANGRRRE